MMHWKPVICETLTKKNVIMYAPEYIYVYGYVYVANFRSLLIEMKLEEKGANPLKGHIQQ